MGVLDDSVPGRNEALQEMLRLARSFVADDHVSEMEAKVLKAWIERHPDMLGVWPVNEVLGLQAFWKIILLMLMKIKVGPFDRSIVIVDTAKKK